MSNDQFNTNVYNFTKEMMVELLKSFDGKVVGSEEMDQEVLMKHFFGDYTPGDTVDVNSSDEEEGSPKGVSKKKKGGKKKKDPNAPKRPTTAFFFYTSTIRNQVKEENPGKKVSELSKIHGGMWGALSDQEKEPFLLQNKEDKERYQKEMEEWNKNKVN